MEEVASFPFFVNTYLELNVLTDAVSSEFREHGRSRHIEEFARGRVLVYQHLLYVGDVLDEPRVFYFDHALEAIGIQDESLVHELFELDLVDEGLG